MPDQVVAVAIHHLSRAGTGAYEVRPGNGDLAIGRTATRLIDELHSLYKRRASKGYGRFSDDAVNFPTSANLRSYVGGSSSFEDTTIAMMGTLAKDAGARAASAGGHVFFAHFERDDVQYVLIAIITDKISAALTTDADLEDVLHLDVDGFRFAGRVDLTTWARGDGRYVSFLKGKGPVAEYFREFLGCDTTIESVVETRNLVEALKAFTETCDLDRGERRAFLDRALEICDRDARANKVLDFTTLANELHPEDPVALLDILADPGRSLSDGFVADRRSLKGLANFKRKTRNWSVEFERRALHEGKVSFDPETNAITLYEVPDDLRNALIEEVPGD